MSNVWVTIVASSIPALIVGLVSSYLTAQKTIATINSRLEETERRLSAVEDDQQERRADHEDVTNRLIRIETNLDHLLQGRIEQSHDERPD